MACMQKSKYRRDKPKYDDMDNLARDAAEAKAAGLSYGQWKAMQDKPVVIVKKNDEIPDGWKVCEHCGKLYKQNKYGNKKQKYCEIGCQKEAQKIRNKDKRKEYHRKYMETKRAAEREAKQAEERKANAEIMKRWEENRKKVANGSC